MRAAMILDVCAENNFVGEYAQEQLLGRLLRSLGNASLSRVILEDNILRAAPLSRFTSGFRILESHPLLELVPNGRSLGVWGTWCIR